MTGCACRQEDDLTKYEQAHHDFHAAPGHAYDCLCNAHLPLQIQIHAAETGWRCFYSVTTSAPSQHQSKESDAASSGLNLSALQMGFYQDMYGPIIIAGLITLVLVAILVLAAIDLAKGGL